MNEKLIVPPGEEDRQQEGSQPQLEVLEGGDPLRILMLRAKGASESDYGRFVAFEMRRATTHGNVDASLGHGILNGKDKLK